MLPATNAPMSKTLEFILADVFTDRLFGSDPLAVFARVTDLATQTMQASAPSRPGRKAAAGGQGQAAGIAGRVARRRGLSGIAVTVHRIT